MSISSVEGINIMMVIITEQSLITLNQMRLIQTLILTILWQKQRRK